jgi:hypothetical protein
MQVESKITDTDKFHDWLRVQTNMPFEEYKDALKKEMLTQRVIGEEIGSLKPICASTTTRTKISSCARSRSFSARS